MFHQVTESQVQLQQRRCPADVRHFWRTVVIRWEFMSSCTNWASTCLAEGGRRRRQRRQVRGCVKLRARPRLTVSRNGLVQSSINTEQDLASWTYHDPFCECPKRLTMPWLHMFRCMLVVRHKSLVSWAVWNQAIEERKCLIQDPSPDGLRLATRWHWTFPNVVWIFPVASGCCSAPPLCCCANRLILPNASVSAPQRPRVYR